MKFEALPGKKHPPGAVVEEDGVNFALFSEDATGVELLLPPLLMEHLRLVGL